MHRIHFIRQSANAKTGPIPVTYSQRETCPPSCPHYGESCYADAGFHTRMVWDKVPTRGGTLAELCASIAALPEGQLWRFNVAGDLPGAGEDVDAAALRAIARANKGRAGFTYTHKRSAAAVKAALAATRAGFVVNASADDAGEADALARTGLPVVCVVPSDAPERTTTPEGRPIVVCPEQTRDDKTCATCGLCARADRKVIVGFRAHGPRVRQADAIARRVIPLSIVK